MFNSNLSHHPITDQQIMSQFFSNHLDFFEGAQELVNLKIFRHDPALVISQTAVLVKYEITVRLTDGTNQMFTLRGSSDPSHNRRKSYDILKNLWTAGFDKGPYVVPKPVGYFEDMHLLLYENFAAPSLMQDFERGEKNCPNTIANSIKWLAKFHETKLPKLPKIYDNFSIEQKKFQRLKMALIEKFGDPNGRISRAADTLLTTEQRLLRPERFVLVHGDFQPNNILSNKTQIAVIDFNDAFFYDELFDLIYFRVQTHHMIKRLRRMELKNHIENAVEEYLFLRNIPRDKLMEKKVALFTAKTLLRIKILTNHTHGSEMLNDIEHYVKQTI
jgi:hypothetical protein